MHTDHFLLWSDQRMEPNPVQFSSAPPPPKHAASEDPSAKRFKQFKIREGHLRDEGIRSIVMGFLRKLSRLSHWDVTSFCVQLKNQLWR